MKALLIGICLCVISTAWSQSTWYEISTPTSNKLRAIDFVNSSVGYIVGDSTTILKTTDGGATWIDLNHSGISTNNWSQDLVDVDFVDELVGFVTLLNDNYGIYKTVDGGMTWTPSSNSMSNMCYKSCTYVTNENNYFVGGAGCFQSGQIDYFQNSAWDVSIVNYETFNPDEYVVEMDFYDYPFFTVGLAAMNGRYMLRSINGGYAWDSLPALLSPDRVFTSVMFSSADTVYAGYEGPASTPGFGFLMSIDAGLTWTNLNTQGFLYPAARDFAKASNNDVYAGGVTFGDMGIIFESTDGTNWTETPILKAINGIDSYGFDVTFAVGDSGYVVSNVPAENIGLGENESFNPITVYPNPTSDFITIENESEEELIYNLVNSHGRIVIRNITLNKQTTIDVSEIPAGIYHLKSTGDLSLRVYKVVKL